MQVPYISLTDDLSRSILCMVFFRVVHLNSYKLSNTNKGTGALNSHMPIGHVGN